MLIIADILSLLILRQDAGAAVMSCDRVSLTSAAATDIAESSGSLQRPGWFLHVKCGGKNASHRISDRRSHCRMAGGLHMKGRGFGLLVNLVVGVVGSFIGGIVFGLVA